MKAEDIKAINDAAFALESVAHLRGLERELLPHAEALRRITANEPPALDHDVMMEDRFGTIVGANGKLERRIVWNLLNHVERAGFKINAVHDGDDKTVVGDVKAAMELIFNLDEAHVFARKEHGKTHTIFLVMGNGPDIISDWNYSDGDPDGFNATMEAFDAEAFV